MSRALKKIIPILFLLLALAAPLLTRAADPANVNWLDCAKSPPTCAVYGITNILSGLGGILITFDAFLVKLAWEFTTNVVNSPVVSQGFGITLNLANLGFVIGIIFIAIATIFRSESYGVKQLLTRLIAMAILVNFSLVIAGVLINFSDQLSIYFLKASTPAGNTADMSSFVNTIVNVASPQGLLFDPPKDQGTVAKAWGWVSTFVGTDKNFLSQLAGLVFAVVFTFMFALALGVIGIMFFLRYFWLTFLLILMPFAWLSWVFPAFKKHWSDWWQHFIKWTFYAPALTFFLYLALAIAQTPSYITNQFDKLGKDQTNNTAAALLAGVQRKPDFLQNIAKEIVIIGLIFGGLVAANKMGVGVAGGALKLADSTKKWALGATKRGAGRTWERTKDRIRSAGKDAQGNTIWKRAGSALQGIPGLRTAGQRIAGFEKIPEDRTKAIEEFRKKNLDQLTDQGLTDYANSRTTILSLEERAAMAREVAKRNLINARPDGRGGMVGGVNNFDTKYLPASERMNTLDDILKNRPELILQTQRRMVVPSGAPPGTAPAPETDAQMITRAMRSVKPGDMADINDRSLGDAGNPMGTTDNQIYTVLNLGTSHLGNLANNGSYPQQKATKNTIGEAYTRYHSGALTLTPQQATKLDALYNYVTNPANINWQYI